MSFTREELCILFQSLELRKNVQVAVGGMRTPESKSMVTDTVRLAQRVTQEIRCMDKYGRALEENEHDG